MAQLNFQADPTNINEDQFDVFPAGTYVAVIVESNESANKSGTGRYVYLKWQILEGPQKGSHVSEWINYIHDKPSVRSQGERALGALQVATDTVGADNTARMHGIPVNLIVSINKDNNNFKHKVYTGKKEAAQGSEQPGDEQPEWKKGKAL